MINISVILFHIVFLFTENLIYLYCCVFNYCCTLNRPTVIVKIFKSNEMIHWSNMSLVIDKNDGESHRCDLFCCDLSAYCIK